MNANIVDITAIIQVIGSIYQNPKLLDNENYFFNEQDFTEEFHKILFGTIYNLHTLGAKEISVNTIEDYLAQKPTSMAVYKTHKGREYLDKISKTVQVSTFDYYYKRMKKMTLLRMYQKAGMDLSWLYDTDNILDVKKKQAQEEWLDNTPIEDIADLVDKKILDIRLKYVDDTNEDMVQAGDNIIELIEQLQRHPEIGYPLYGNLTNTITRGARLKKFYLRSAATGVGKAIPNDTIIPTPIGNKKVGEIKPGDMLFGADGKPTTVLQIHPQPAKKTIYKVYFEDGRTAECCEDHLWEVYYKGHNEDLHETLDVKTLLKKAKASTYGFKSSMNKGYRWKIPICAAAAYPEKTLPIDPYVLGLFLGDGCFRYTPIQKILTFSSKDIELVEAIAKIMNWNYKKSSNNNYTYSFQYKDNHSHPNIWVEEFLKDYPELWNAKSEDKFIPNEYLYGSIQQRYDLLAGLLDTDGSIDSTGRVSYFTISDKMKDQVIQLAYSLGFKIGVTKDTRPDKYSTGHRWTIRFNTTNENNTKIFKLTRKLNIAANLFKEKGNGREYKRYLFNNIINIEKTNEEVDMTCFTVDADDHLFLMNDYIVTHNTRAMIADVCSIACDEIYDLHLQKWVNNGTKEPALFITTEQEVDEIQTMMLAFLSGVDENHIVYNNYENGEVERVLYAGKLIQKCPLHIKKLPDFSLQDIENTIKYSIQEWGTKYIFFDYLHSSMKILGEVSSKTGIKGLREDNILFMISIRLKDICNEYGVFIMTATQLNSKKK